MSALPRKAAIAAMAVLGVGAIVAIALLDRPQPNPAIAGMVRQTEVRIAPEITGRLVEEFAKAGWTKNDIRALCISPDRRPVGEAWDP